MRRDLRFRWCCRSSWWIVIDLVIASAESGKWLGQNYDAAADCSRVRTFGKLANFIVRHLFGADFKV